MINQLKRLIPGHHGVDSSGPINSRPVLSSNSTTIAMTDKPAFVTKFASLCCKRTSVKNKDKTVIRMNLSDANTHQTNFCSESNELNTIKQTGLEESIYAATTTTSVTRPVVHSPMHTRKLSNINQGPDLEFICQIADSYNMPDDSDTLSYISNCLNQQTSNSFSGSTSKLDRQRKRKASHCASISEKIAPSMSASYSEPVSDRKAGSRKHKRSSSLGSSRPKTKAAARSKKPVILFDGQHTLL